MKEGLILSLNADANISISVGISFHYNLKIQFLEGAGLVVSLLGVPLDGLVPLPEVLAIRLVLEFHGDYKALTTMSSNENIHVIHEI